MSARRHIRYRAIGASDTFTPAASTSTSCPPGYHWEDDETPIRGLRGLGACVPDKVATLRIPPKPAAASTLPAPVSYSPPATTDAAAAPSPPVARTLPPQATACPAPWPLWWLLVAAAAGAGAGVYFAAEEKKKRRRPNGRIAA